MLTGSPELRVLIACEHSGTVRNAFTRLGHDAHSCDLKASTDGSNRHIQDDVRNVLGWGWDLLIVAHPPCTRLCNSGVRWIKDPSAIRADRLGEDFSASERMEWRTLSDAAKLDKMQAKLRAGADLFNDLWQAPVDRIACENPIMHKYARALIKDWVAPQYVQPWQFGDWESKKTGLWLRGLEPLVPTYATLDEARAGLGKPFEGEGSEPEQTVHKASPSADRGAIRSKFFDGIANAMAEQWGGQALDQWEQVA